MEMNIYRKTFTSFDTIYIGGGTPSLLGSDVITGIIDTARINFEIAVGAEITIETNPGDMSHEKITGIKKAGINRVNLGVQSFNDNDLKFLGRRHSAADSLMAFHSLRDAGFNNVGIDLIYGLMDQSIHGWLKNLERALELSPEHISCYQLTIEGKTPFNAMKKKGKLSDLGEDAAGSIFSMNNQTSWKKRATCIMRSLTLPKA
jgi:oxygen-independent coproporphyrinogen-3 oxidase